MNLSESTYEAYTSNSNPLIEFKLVRNEEDFENKKINFYPEFTHQFFGESEKIFGYKNPQVKIYFSASSLTPYFDFSYDEVIASDKDISADDVKSILLEKLDNVVYDIDSFKQVAINEPFPQFGKVIHQYVRENEKGENEVFEICHVTGDEILSESFQRFNERLQYFLLFFVDGSSFIDVTDDNWEYFLIYQKSKTCDGTHLLQPVGFMTVYKFFAYPDHSRHRISQVLVLPPHQRRGHGHQLLSAFYAHIESQPRIKDITVEDPSEQFQSLRDYVDCERVLALGVKRGSLAGFTRAVAPLKITPRQVVTVYEILGLLAIQGKAESQHVLYKHSVIERLHELFGKAKDYANSEAQAYLNMGQEQKATLIEREYERLLEYYTSIAEKLRNNVL